MGLLARSMGAEIFIGLNLDTMRLKLPLAMHGSASLKTFHKVFKLDKMPTINFFSMTCLLYVKSCRMGVPKLPEIELNMTRHKGGGR